VDLELNLTTESVEQAWPAAPLCVEPQTSIREVLERMSVQCRGSVLICRNRVLEGIFTERDALAAMANLAKDPSTVNLDAPIESVMIHEPHTLKNGATVASAIQQMSSGGYRRLPIVDQQGYPTGVFQVKGLIHYLVEHFPQSVYNLPPKPQTLMQERDGA